MPNGYMGSIFPGDIGSETDIAYKQMSAAADQRAADASAAKGPGFFDEVAKGFLTGFGKGITRGLGGQEDEAAMRSSRGDSVMAEKLAKAFLDREVDRRLFDKAASIGSSAFQ